MDNSTFGRKNITEVSVWITYSYATKVWLAAMIIISICGTVLNISLFIAIFSRPQLRKGSGVLILHYVFLEIFISTVSFPIVTISTFMAQFQPLTPNFCNWSILFYYLFVHCASWSALIIGCNRFIAMVFPHNYTFWSKKPALFGFIFLGWIVVFCVDFPPFFGIGGQFVPNKPWGACGTKVTSAVFNSITVAFTTTIPVGLLGLLYLIIFLKVFVEWFSHRRTVYENTATHHRQKDNKRLLFERRFRCCKMLFGSFLWISICCLPAPLGSSAFSKQYASVPFLSLVFRGLSLFGYAFNPVIESLDLICRQNLRTSTVKS